MLASDIPAKLRIEAIQHFFRGPQLREPPELIIAPWKWTMVMEQWLAHLLQSMDPYIFRLFLLTENPVANFFIGSLLLAIGASIVGEVTLFLAIRLNRSHIERLKQEIRHHERLSVEAYEMGDRRSYQALNKAANDAWGRHFFTMAAYSAGMLWPVPFALGWMQIHFAQVQFPLFFPLSLVFGKTVGFTFCFIPIYILCRMAFRQIHRWLPGLASTATRPASPG